MALTNLASLMAQAGITTVTDAQRAQYNSLILGVSSLVKQQFQRDIEQQSYVEYYSGNNSFILQLLQFPVLSVARVNVDYKAYWNTGVDPYDVAYDLVSGVDYALMAGAKGVGSSGCLRRIGTVWGRHDGYVVGKVGIQAGPPAGNILVGYTAGLSPVPAAIQMAVNAAVLRAARFATVGGVVQSAGYEDASIGFFAPEDMIKVFGTIENALSSYRMPVV